MNSPGDRFVPPREMAAERPTPPQGSFTVQMENDAGRFREYSLRNREFSPRGKFTHPKGRFFPLREKIANNFTSSREKVREAHVSPVIHVFPGGGPSSSRYRMMSPMDKFPSLKEMVRNKHAFSRERVVEMERPVRRVIPPSQR